jgi:hypothetical protein
MSIVLERAEDHAQSQLLMLTALDFGFLYHRVQSLIKSQFYSSNSFQKCCGIQCGIYRLKERIQFS